MRLDKMNIQFILLSLFAYVELYESSYYYNNQGRRCFNGNCSPYQQPRRLYGDVPDNWRVYNRLYWKPTYAKPAYYKPSYAYPSYQLNQPSWSRTYSYQPVQPVRSEVLPYEVVEVNHPNPEALVYYPVSDAGPTDQPLTTNVYGSSSVGSHHQGSRLTSALNPEREEEYVSNSLGEHRPSHQPEGEREGVGNEVDRPWEKVETPDVTRFGPAGSSLEPPRCVKHETCNKFCRESINSFGVFGSCHNGSCRCGIKHS